MRAIDGGSLDWFAAFTRALVPLALGVVPQVGPALGLAVYTFAVFSPRRQGLHDRAAGSLVVRAR